MNKVLIFVLGAGIGSLVTWKIIEEKYRRIADEEIESVIEHFKKREEEKCENVEQAVSDNVLWNSDEEKQEYKEKVNELEYVQDEDCTVKIEQGPDQIEPYVISPEEFGEFGNVTKSWTYYADSILADENDEIINMPENIIADALDHFGEYEDDCVHVRNENLEWDIEILRSEKFFSEINKGDE